jgi:hypothetical protein
MMIRGAADRLWLMKFQCGQWQKRFKRTAHFPSLHFPQVSRSILHEIVSDKFRFRKFSSRWVPKLLTDEHTMKRRASALTFLTVSKALTS